MAVSSLRPAFVGGWAGTDTTVGLGAATSIGAVGVGGGSAVWPPAAVVASSRHIAHKAAAAAANETPRVRRAHMAAAGGVAVGSCRVVSSVRCAVARLRGRCPSSVSSGRSAAVFGTKRAHELELSGGAWAVFIRPR